MLAYALIPPYYHVTATVIGTRYQNDITPSNQSMTISATALLGGTQNDAPPITDFRLYTQLLTSPELGASIVDDPLIHRVFSRSREDPFLLIDGSNRLVGAGWIHGGGLPGRSSNDRDR